MWERVSYCYGTLCAPEKRCSDTAQCTTSIKPRDVVVAVKCVESRCVGGVEDGAGEENPLKLRECEVLVVVRGILTLVRLARTAAKVQPGIIIP